MMANRRTDIPRVERRRDARSRVNRTHIRAFLDQMRENPDEMDAPGNALVMRPYVFGEDRLP